MDGHPQPRAAARPCHLDYVAQYPDPLRVRAGEKVRIDREDDEYSRLVVVHGA